MDVLERPLDKTLARISGAVDFRRVAAEALKVRPGVRACVSGLSGASRGLFIAGLWQVLRRPLIVVVAEDAAARSLAIDTEYFHNRLNAEISGRVCIFPSWQTDPYAGLVPHAEIQQSRASALWRLRHNMADIVVASIRSAVSRLIPPAAFDACCLQISAGDEISQELVAEHLGTAGYLRQEPVSAPGEFSIRGGIVDVFSPLMRSPVRIEFFGDSVDSIREFDLDDQRSRAPLQRVDILPMQESLVSRDLLREWARRAGDRWADEEFSRDLAEKKTFAENGELFPGAQFLIPLVAPLEASLIKYAENGVLVFEEPEVLDETHGQFFSTLEKRHDQTVDSGGLALRPEELVLKPEDIAEFRDKYRCLDLDRLGAANGETDAAFRVDTQPTSKFHGHVKDFAEAVRTSYGAGIQAVLLGDTLGMAERLRDILSEYEIPFRLDFGAGSGTSPDAALGIQADSIAPIVGIGRISGGFRLAASGIEVYAESDIFDETEHVPEPHRRRRKLSAFIAELQDLKPGDYVVHADHGIGTYEGVAIIHDRECMILNYQGADRLYVPLERLDLVQKYSSTEGAKPQLDKLGGTTWIARKTRVRRAIRDMAQELLKLYAERKVAIGHAFGPDTAWQKEFEDAFPYEETPDQLTAIADIKRDMEGPLPMDRLVCGDVGYGKTEVAMRAVFKAAAEGKQVAVLSPTTVLCFQHFETFKERFAAFPVTIAMLSRFVNAKELKANIANIEAGRVDVVVGTHRLLSKDIHFRDLGLIIVDEEQRFGVAHKERLKQMRKQVDVLTLTATPIPRTLNMAMSGLRDISVIETPPRDRLAIQTVVVKFRTAVIENAINFELDRGGQVYVVHNRVESIYSLASMIQKLCPRARIGVGHAQLSEQELEKVMTRFMHHEFDVLVSTTIVENGLDIPLANTLVVNRADRFGLSQLYQLRGRVGRSNRPAFAYLLIPSDESITEIARKRLAAIREFSELGAGFRIAALDLELRGAGNLLGGQQHGHIEAIGFDLYCQLLERTVEEMRTGMEMPEVETAINLRVDLRIPAGFVDDELQRLRVYKQVASSRSEDEVDSFYRELEDRFGELPLQVRNLLEYARLRILGRNRGVKAIDRVAEGVEIKFSESARIDPERIVELVGSDTGIRFVPPASLRIRIATGIADAFERISAVLRDLS